MSPISAVRSIASSLQMTRLMGPLPLERRSGDREMPVSARRQLFDLSDDMATKIDVQFYAEAREALLKALSD